MGERYQFVFDAIGLMEITYIFSLERIKAFAIKDYAIIKSITAREIFKKFPEIKKAL